MLFDFILFILFLLMSLTIAQIKSKNIKIISMSLFCFLILYVFIGYWAWIYLLLISASYVILTKLNLYFSISLYFLLFLILKISFIKYRAMGYLIYEPSSFELTLGHPINIFSLVLTLLIFAKEGMKKNNFLEFLGVSILIPILGRPVTKISEIKTDLLNEVSDYNLALDGTYFILLGLIKKFVLADRLMTMISSFFNGNYNHVLNTFSLCIMPLYLYLEITSLFDIGNGTLKLLGIRVEKSYDRPFAQLGIRKTLKSLNVKLAEWNELFFLKKLSLSNKNYLNEIQWSLLTVFFILIAYPFYNNLHHVFWFMFVWISIETILYKLIKKVRYIYWGISYSGFIYLSYLTLAPVSNFAKILKEKIGLKYGYDQIAYIPLDVKLALGLMFLILIFDHFKISLFENNRFKWLLSGVYILLILFFYNNDFRSFLFLKF